MPKNKTMRRLLHHQKRSSGRGRLALLHLAMQTEDTPENFAWIGCKSFVGGLFLSWFVFLFCIIGIRMSLHNATWFSITLSTLLSFGMAFSSIVRCYVLMLLPQLFSKRGRQVLAAYAFLLAIGGPLNNSLHNIGILSTSLACGQEQVKRNMRQVVDMVREPLQVLTATLQTLVKNINKAVQPLRDIVMALSRAFAAVFSVIARVTSWLNNAVSVCNKTIGTPYQRCVRSLDDAIEDCQVKLGIMQFLCSVVTVIKHMCLLVKVVDTMCGLMDMISDAVVETAKRKLATFRQHVADMLYVSIELEHSVSMNTTASRSLGDVMAAVVNEIEDRTQEVRLLFSWTLFLPGVAFAFLFLKAFIYRYKFLTSDRYDNRYISHRIMDIDLVRFKRNLPTVLPLECRERRIYTKVTTLRLVRGEKRRLISAFFFLTLTSVQIFSYLISDYGIYWTLQLIRQQGLNGADSFELPTTDVEVVGKGALAAMYKELGKAFQPPSSSFDLDPVPCLPQPTPPDKAGAIQIGVLLAASWILALTEPYGLRLRNVVMSHYYPQRAQQRALWLHNHILMLRSSFVGIVRQKLLQRIRRLSGVQNHTMWQKLVNRYGTLQRWCKTGRAACAICASPDRAGNRELFTPCPSLICHARYCIFCVKSAYRCVLCYQPMYCGLTSDISEAQDSSEEDLQLECLEDGSNW